MNLDHLAVWRIPCHHAKHGSRQVPIPFLDIALVHRWALIALIGLLSCQTHASTWACEQEFIVATTNAIAHKDIIVGEAFGEDLLAFSGTCTNESLSQTINLVDSFRKICLFEETTLESNLLESIAISSNVVAQTVTTPEDWHFWASRLLLSGGQALFDDAPASYSTLTNTLLVGNASSAQPADTNAIMRSLLDAFELEDLSCHQAFHALSGVAAAMIGLPGNATNHITGLPPKYGLIIEEILNAE